ncbi:MAG TPA: hypothetical protein DCY93_03700 [Firmicutes bacterium]|nr:hypothetical protein [Bacillota bacterium]
MKTKYTLTLQDGTQKEIFLKKRGKTYAAYYNQKEYSPVDNGTPVKFNGIQKVVDSRVIFFDIEGIKIITYFNNWAAPKLTVEQGVKVKSNIMANNLKLGLPLLIVFVVVMIVILIITAK